MEYVINRLTEISCQEISDRELKLLQKHPLIKATTKDYVRENQIRFILQPVINELLNIFDSKQDIERHLNQIRVSLQERASAKGYACRQYSQSIESY